VRLRGKFDVITLYIESGRLKIMFSNDFDYSYFVCISDSAFWED